MPVITITNVTSIPVVKAIVENVLKSSGTGYGSESVSLYALIPYPFITEGSQVIVNLYSNNFQLNDIHGVKAPSAPVPNSSATAYTISSPGVYYVIDTPKSPTVNKMKGRNTHTFLRALNTYR